MRFGLPLPLRIKPRLPWAALAVAPSSSGAGDIFQPARNRKKPKYGRAPKPYWFCALHLGSLIWPFTYLFGRFSKKFSLYLKIFHPPAGGRDSCNLFIRFAENPTESLLNRAQRFLSFKSHGSCPQGPLFNTAPDAEKGPRAFKHAGPVPGRRFDDLFTALPRKSRAHRSRPPRPRHRRR